MTMPSAPTYPVPRSEDEFERLVLRLMRRHWQLPQLERLRESTRREGGIHLLEISGRPRLAAVRCELKPLETAVAFAAIREAAELAASTKLPIGRFVVATTAHRPAGFQRSLLELNRALQPDSLSSIEVLAWEDIQELLDEYPQLVAESASSAKRQALARADARVSLTPRCVTGAAEDEAADPVAREIGAAAAEIDAGRCQFARLRLLRIREQQWAELSAALKFRVLTNLAVAWLKEGERRRAAMLLIAAKSLEPDEEAACTNEALAHEILGEHERAHALAERLRMQFPSSSRALALWLNNAPPLLDIKTLEEAIAPELAADGEVALVTARCALARGAHECAERYARNVTATLPDHFSGWLALAQAILLGEISAHAAGAGDGDDSRAREAESCFTQAIALAQSEGSASAEVQGLIGRAQARIALRDTEGAGRDIEDAHGLEREDANGLCEYGIVLRSRGSLAEAIAVFRRAVAVGGRDDAEYHLAVSLRERDDPGDLQEAADLLGRAVSRPGAVPEGDFAFAVASAIDAFVTLERWQDAETALNSLPAGQIPAVTMYTMRANLMRAQGKFDQAWKLADEALAALLSDTSAENRRQLAALLHDLGRYGDALPLWQALAAGASAGADRRRLLDCASRLGRDSIVLELNRETRSDGTAADDGLSERLGALERNDPENALSLLNDYLAEHPGDAVFRLRRSLVARRLGRTDLVIADPNSMPPARELPPELARGAILVMREGGRAAEALAYAYELLRRRPADVNAHRAYLAAFGPIGPTPHVADFDAAGPGAAVYFTDQESNTDRWVVLEDGADPDESRDEFSPSAPIAKALKGRRAGDRFQLAEGRFSRKSAVVKQIVNKYAWRYQDCLQNWAARFPGVPEVETGEAHAESIDWSSVETFFDSVEIASNGKRDDAARAAEHAYAQKALPIHGVANRLGLNDLQTMFVLAQRPDAPIKCCAGTRDELDAALAAFGRSNSVVIDLTAIATLCLLGKLGLLASWPRQFIISHSTLAELRRLAFEDTLMRLPPGFSAAVNGNGADSKRTDVQLKGLGDALQSVCRIRDGAILAALDHDRRERMVRLFGRHGAESIAIASMPGHVLWTDDRVLAEFARAEFGVRRVWTESAFKARTQAGILDPAELATASTKLAGWGYAFTAPSVEMLLRAGAVAQWNPEQFPLRQALDQFSSETMDFGDAMRMAVELIVRIYNEPGARGARRTVTMRLLDRIAARAGGREAIEGLPRSLPVRFGMDLIRARELSDVVRGWTAQQSDLALSA